MMSFKLSLKNIKKSIKDYSIYFITLIFGVMIFYVFNSIDSQTAMFEMNSSKYEIVKSLVQIIGAVSIFVSIILGFLIVYANNFLIRRRKKELGLYMTLGMSKGKISKLLLVETILIGVISLGIGLVFGIFGSQILSILVAKMFEVDMTKFSFVFSKDALFKTCMYFGIIYLLVMIFNMITISRYKLIDLLNAGKKNEIIKVKNKFVTFILFILSIAFTGYAYYLLKHNALVNMDKRFVLMLISGALGTLLFFASLSGFLLRAIQINKKNYLKDLNMFILKQINSRINTNTISMTIICLMLLLTIGILSGAMSLSQTFNTDISENNLNDVTIVNYLSTNLEEQNDPSYVEVTNLEEQLKKDRVDLSKYLKEYVQYNIYSFKEESTNMSNFLSDDAIFELKKEYGEAINIDKNSLRFIKESEYNKLMDLSNKSNLKVNLNDNQYLFTCNFEKLQGYYNESLKNKKIISINSKEYIPENKECISVSFENYNTSGNFGIVVVKDSVIEKSNNTYLIQNNICGNYKVNKEELEKTDEAFTNYLKTIYDSNDGNGTYEPYERIATKVDMQVSSVGISAILTFLGLYLGIIFSITSAAVLAIQQLSQSSDNKERYEVLRKIGVDTKMINKSLFIQIGIYFMLPLSLALVHSFVGLSELNKLISMFGHLDLTSNIILTASFITLVYGGYFIATYIASKSIIKER